MGRVGAVGRDVNETLTEATGAPVCAAHGRHSPHNLTVEFHHVVPVAWQLHTAVPPALQPSPGPDTSGRGQLWDDRGVWLCPTGHRNVHAWIVKLMRAAAAAQTNDPQAAYIAVWPKGKAPVELPIALDALTRFEPLGAPLGGLLALTLAGEWGQV